MSEVQNLSRTFKDNINTQDGLSPEGVKRIKHPSPYCRTKVWGVDEFGQKLFEEENQVVLGGSLFTLQKVWGVNSPLNIETLNSIMNVATSGDSVPDLKNTFVCLFGVGYGGAGDTAKSVKDVKYYEREIFDMVPLRVPEGELTEQEKLQYFFKTTLSTGRNAYYLKRFEQTPEISVLWKDGIDDEDGTAVEEGVHTTQRTEAIETFVEMHLKITKKDIREFFDMNGDIDEARFNSIGLFTGVLCDLGNGEYDFKEVRLFSKLNIPNEYLTLRKDIDIYYRVYTS